jgi:ALG6/ALG8 glycosyltransferase family protein
MTRVQHVLLFVLATLLAVSLLHTPGTTDVGFWMTWLRNAADHGLRGGYEANQADYPPLSSAILFLVAQVARWLGIEVFIAFKLSLIAFLLLTSAVFWFGTRDLFLTTILQLTLTLNSVALGYIDIYTAPALILALWALRKQKLLLFTFFYTITCLIKWQPVIIAPFLLIYILDTSRQGDDRRVDLKKLLRSVVLPVAAGFALIGWVYGEQTVLAFQRALLNPFLSGNALNASWVVTQTLHALAPQRFGPLVDGHSTIVMTEDPRITIPLQLLFLGFYVAACLGFARRERSYENLILYALSGYVAYFTFNTGVHENHLFLACILAAVLLGLDRKYRTVFATWTLVANANLFILYGADGFGMKSTGSGYVDLAVVVSAVNVLIFLAFFTGVIGGRTELAIQGSWKRV